MGIQLYDLVRAPLDTAGISYAPRTKLASFSVAFYAPSADASLNHMPLVYKTLVPILFLLVATALTASVALRSSLENVLLKERFLQASDTVNGEVRRYLTSSTLTEPDTPERRVLLAHFTEQIKDAAVARVTVWDTNQTIVYSDLASVVGVAAPNHPEVRRALIEGQPFFVRKSTDDRYPRQSAIGDFLAIYTPVSFLGQVVGVVETHVVAEAILRPLNQEIDAATLFFLTISALIALTILVVFRIFILNPISRAKEMAHAISQGDFQERGISIYKDEIGELAKSLNVMRQQLQSLVTRLEDRVTERTRKLREEETRLSASLGSISAGFAIIDRERRVVYANDALRRVLKLDADVRLEDVVHFFGNACDIQSVYERSVAAGTVTDIPSVQHDSSYYRVYVAPVTMPGPRNEIIGSVLLIDDVTEAKVIERTKEEFFTIASHELRTPLTAIRANAALLKSRLSSKAPTDTNGIIDDIHAASIRLIKLVHDFLDVAALEQKTAPLKLKKIETTALVRSVVEELRGLAREKKITLRCAKAPAAVMVKADEERLKQVLMNLIGNAIHYTRKGSVTVSVETGSETVTIRVADTGVGIAPENQKLLFRKFQQAGKDILARDLTQSTGLGLYISKLIVESMGGSIRLERSEPGKGSVFSIDIPIAHENTV